MCINLPKHLNEDFYKKTRSFYMSPEMKTHRLRWLGHVMRILQRMAAQSCPEMDPNKEKTEVDQTPGEGQ